MKTPILSLLLIPGMLAAQITVCTSGCQYQTAQAALDASNDGDTIILAAGQNLGSLTVPGKRHNLTFKSSLIDTYPRNYRIDRSDPALARLTGVTMGNDGLWLAGVPASTLTNAPGAVPQPHGLSIGDPVTIGGSQFSAYECASVNQPPYTDGACDASRVGYFNIRTDTGLANGMAIDFQGRTLPPPLSIGTLYYIVNFVYGGSVGNADKFQIAATPGGAPITIPPFNPSGQDLVVEIPPLPRRIGDTLYVVATPTPSTVQLSATLGGTPITFTQTGRYYNGSGISAGFRAYANAPVHDITFDGIEVLPTADYPVYYPFYVSGAIGSDAGEHYNISILRCWIHGADDQQDFPMAMINIAGRNLEIGWSVIENAYATSNDTQNIGFMSTGNVSIHDNEIKGSAEGIMSGGNFPWFAFKRNTTGITVSRNYIWKPLKAYIGIVAAYLGPTRFQFLSRYGGADCSSVSSDPNLGHRCFAYESNEADPANAVVSRTEWTAAASASVFTASGTAGQQGFIYLLNGRFHMDYNFSGQVACPSGVICTYAASPAFSSASTRIGIAIIGSGGTFDGSFYQENRNVWSKNLLESKYGDNWLIEGNVFHRQDNCDSGSTCQDPAINLTVSGNGSGPGDPVNYMVSSSNSIIRNNIFRYLSSGIIGVGKTFAVNNGGTGLTWEFAGFGQSANNQVVNNLFMDLGSTEYSGFFGGAVVRQQSTANWLVEHNTAVDVRIGFLADGAASALYRSNVVTPYRSACPGGGCSTPSATSNVGVQDQPGPGPVPYFGGNGANTWFSAVGGGNVDAASQFLNNVLMNRNGFVYTTARGTNYPASTYMIQSDDPGRNPGTLFVNWQERDNSVPPNGLNYRAGNYRLAAGMAAAYPSYDQRAIGADIDEIEALTGQSGVDVERGRPTFAQRSERSVSAGSAVTVLSYLPNGSSCTIRVWPNPAYSGTPGVDTTDNRAEVLGGFTFVALSGLQPGASYYGKRWCGSEVDVFQFSTPAAPPALPLLLAPPSGAASCQVEYGSTAALGSSTSPVATVDGQCEIVVPAAAYWRNVYLSATGQVIARGNIRRRGL